jgi:hypothetical protein
MQPMDGKDDEDRERGVVRTENREFAGRGHGALFFPGAVILLSAALTLMPVARERGGATGLIASYIAALAVWFALIRLPGRARRFIIVVLVAAALRAPFLFEDALLSRDVLRYRWDGRVVASGQNPYRFAPVAPNLTHLRDASFQHIEHREIRSVYPPMAQLLFGLWSSIGGSLIVWRLLLFSAEIGVLRILWRLGPATAIAYATCPLVVMEGFWNGHIDVISGAALAAATLRVIQNPGLAGALFGAAISLKFIPITAVPALGRIARRSFWAALVVAGGIPVAIFALLGGFNGGLADYATRWSFNSPAYAAIRGLIVTLDLDRWLRGLWTVIKDPLHLEFSSDTVYRHLYPDFVARMVLLMLFVSALVVMLRRTLDVTDAVVRSVGLLLLCSPTIHPWYWLTILPLVVSGRAVWLALAVASPASYLLYAPGAEPGSVFIACYIPALIIGSAQLCSGFRDRVMSRWMAFRGDSPS